MVAERFRKNECCIVRCSLAKISMVAELLLSYTHKSQSCSLAKISMVAEHVIMIQQYKNCCSLAKISMVAEPR